MQVRQSGKTVKQTIFCPALSPSQSVNDRLSLLAADAQHRKRKSFPRRTEGSQDHLAALRQKETWKVANPT